MTAVCHIRSRSRTRTRSRSSEKLITLVKIENTNSFFAKKITYQ
jgi:hypothetical protein